MSQCRDFVSKTTIKKRAKYIERNGDLMRKLFYWLIACFWIIIIFYASAQPYEKQDIKPLMTNSIDLSFLVPIFDWVSFTYHKSEVSINTLGVEGFIEFFIRKGAHVTVFFLLSCLIYLALKKSTSIPNSGKIIISFFLTVAYAGIDEYHQSFTANRTAYFGDVILDAFGAFVACVCIYAFHRKKRSIGRQKTK